MQPSVCLSIDRFLRSFRNGERFRCGGDTFGDRCGKFLADRGDNRRQRDHPVISESAKRRTARDGDVLQ